MYVPASSRRAKQLLACLSELSQEFARGVVLCDPYSQTFSAARMTPDERLSALMPYRSFDASRLKLSGSANWDLEDALYLAFREPESLETFDVLDPGPQDAPLSAAERPAELLKVARLWDARSLLRLSSVGPRRPYKGVRLFNALKNSSTDRQIADRRGRNWVEGKIRGSSDSSRFLSTGPSLTNLFLNPASHRFSINVMDRNDFYHQISASPQRSLKNLLMPPLPVDWLCGTQALREFQAARKGGSCEATELYLYFGAFIQGDALGVEFATSAHSACAKEGGLLEDQTRILESRLFLGSARRWSGDRRRLCYILPPAALPGVVAGTRALERVQGPSWAPPPAGRATGFEKDGPCCHT